MLLSKYTYIILILPWGYKVHEDSHLMATKSSSHLRFFKSLFKITITITSLKQNYNNWSITPYKQNKTKKIGEEGTSRNSGQHFTDYNVSVIVTVSGFTGRMEEIPPEGEKVKER